MRPAQAAEMLAPVAAMVLREHSWMRQYANHPDCRATALCTATHHDGTGLLLPRRAGLEFDRRSHAARPEVVLAHAACSAKHNLTDADLPSQQFSQECYDDQLNPPSARPWR